MAKEIHGYIKTLIVLAGIIFAGGGYAMKITGNTSDISKMGDKHVLLDSRVDDVKDDIHRLELSGKDTQALAAKAAEAQQESVEMFTVIMKQSEERAKADAAANTTMQIDIAKIQVQVGTLIKDNEE